MPASITIADIAGDIEQRIPQALSLGVARMASDNELSAHKLLLAASAAESFREHCRRALESVRAGTDVSYTAAAELGDDEFFLIDDSDVIEELAVIGDLKTSIGTLPAIAPADLDLAIQLYVVALGEGGGRVLFVQRTNPRLSYGAGRFFAIGRERLTRIDEPAFSFSPKFDFILGDDWALVMDQRSFEILFRQIGLVEKHISTWIQGITKYLPMDPAHTEQLREVALHDSRTWRRLREIERRGHLANVSLADVRKYAKFVGLDPDSVVANDKLVFDPAERFSFLHLLNEDLYKGQLTDQLFEAQRKTSA